MSETTSFSTRAALIARAQGYQSTEPSFARFLKAVAEATEPEDLARHDPEALEALFRRSYGRLGKRELASHNIYILPPDAPGRSEIIEVFSADMPFIVDSVLAAIRSYGGVVRALSHPILLFDPATYRVLELPTPGSRLESFLHVEIDPLPDIVVREAMKGEIDDTLTDVGRAVAGWRPMLERVRKAVQDWHDTPPRGVPPATMAEAMHFLGWLVEHNFTFLGMREYRLEGTGAAARLVPVPDSELGILEDPNVLFLRAGASYVEMTPQHAAFMAEPTPLLVTKANIKSRVHRRTHLDYVGVKLYDAQGAPSGELRVVGLFTSMSYTTPNIEVPLVRRKVSDVLKRAGHDPQGHAGKALINVLDTYPREELFQISEEKLLEFASIIASLTDRPRVRVLSRIDRFDNFVSVLVYLPRDRYDSDVRQRIGAYLAEVYEGRVSAFYPHFPEGELVRVHFIIGRNGGKSPDPDRAELEAGVAERILTFGDRLKAAAGDGGNVSDFLEAFPPDYQHANSAEAALDDIAIIRLLPDERAIALRLAPREDRLGLKVYHRGGPIPLSDRVPMLENFGFRVIDEDTFTVTPRHGVETFVHDMQLEADGDADLSDRARAERTEDAILAVWRGEAESDPLNQLTLRRDLNWHDVEILRALTRYLKQVGISFSRSYLNTVMARQAEVSAALVRLFHARNDPHHAGHRERAAQLARETVQAAIESTGSLDEDRILRRYLNLVEAVTRTNAYQRDHTGARRPALALKFDCTSIDGLPEPRPFREIFVYSPRVEGVHLRFGPIARGGLRWSDRPEDFRTEVLGLVKAQQVKNAIIVPVGAKGAFVPRLTPPAADRDAMLREGTSCYRIFVSTLLDVTDNLEGDTVVPPPDVVRRDGDDPYLVVAADKGTARFSDTANAIAIDRDFWLGDAFASGGSAGYDHKAMGITARGGWEAVKRHFRELDRDIQATPFTAVGVGDMSGDVFGNGMLLSPHLKLVAAFDHRDIFIDPDPDPDPAVGLAERQRLFELPRSSWQDYNAELLSRGGGIYSRGLKTVALFAEARKVLGLGSEPVTPADVVRAILRADVDLIWFGGIGTYVKAAGETDASVGDKANDAVRVNGGELRARVVGEGANLAVTQLGRVEYALRGGRLNTDAIDNSAGVNSSDLEVNIKIALGSLTREGKLTTTVRNEFLASMTDEVAALCLRNNYLQSLTLSVEEARGLAAFPEHLNLIATLEAEAGLNRTVEGLPDDAALRQRAQGARGLTRPELAVLIAYAKNHVYARLLESRVPDDPYLGKELYRYFPDRLTDTFEATVTGHRLRREVISTVLANAMINRGGLAFVSELSAATSADVGRIAAAYAAARDVFDTPDLNRELDALDGRLPGRTQLALYTETQSLLRRQSLWFLRNGRLDAGLAPLITRHAAGVAELGRLLGELVGPAFEGLVEERTQRFLAGGAGRDLARRFGEFPVLGFAPDVALVAERAPASLEDAARALFGVLDAFRLARVIAEGEAIVLADRFDRMALDRALANLMRAQRELALEVLGSGDGPVADRLTAWRNSRPEAIARVADAVTNLTEGDMTVSRLSVAAGLLGDLAGGA